MKGYKDHAGDTSTEGRNRASSWFVNRLFDMLENADADGIADIICWQPHGRCFVMRDQSKLNSILPQFFKVTKVSSFLRQLNIYGFSRVARGQDRGGYYHELFLQNRRNLAQRITPIKVKGAGVRAKGTQEPNFWEMPWVNNSSNTNNTDLVLPSSAMTRSMSIVSHDTTTTTKEEEEEETTSHTEGPLNECTPVAPTVVKIKKFFEVASPLSAPQAIEDGMKELLEMVGSKPFLHEFVWNGVSLLDHDLAVSDHPEDPAAAAHDLNELEFVMHDFQDESVGLGFDAFLQSYEEENY